ncbi:MAG: hypothetical protein JW874_15705 [Spirochaetales bacterium]|nr:hypothetical protein [Spirochaetales bacterium]
MNNNFDVGDIIVLIIVVIIFFIFRQLDRNNRSLDKIKRFGEKIKGELSSFVDARAADLKNLNIELDIHRKTSNEVLKRINDYETGFKDRLKVFGDLHRKIEDYDAALKELNTMSLRVNENLQQLHQESDFVTKLSGKLKQVGTRLDQLEKQIPDLALEFRKINEKTMKNFGKEAMKNIQGEIEKAMEEVESASARIEDFRQTMDSLENRAVDIENETLADLKDRADRVLAGSDTEIDKIRQELDEVFDDLRSKAETLESSYQASLVEATARGQDLEGEIFQSVRTNIEKAAEKNRSELLEILKTRQKTVDDSLLAYTGRIDEQFGAYTSKMNEQLGSYTTKINGQLGEYTSRIDEKLGTYTSRIEKELSAGRDKIDEVLTTGLAKIDKQLSTETTKVEGYLNANKGRIDENMKSYSARLDEWKKKTSAEVNQFVLSLKDQYTAVSADTDKQVKSAAASMHEIKTAVDMWKKDILTGIDKDKDLYNEKLSDFMNRATGSVDTFIAQTQKKLQEINTQVQEKEAEFARNIAAVRTKNEGMINDLSSGLDENRKKLDIQYKKVFSELEGQINNYESDLTYRFSRIEDLGNDIDSLEASLRQSMDIAVDKLKADFREYESSIDDMRTEGIKKAEDDVGHITEVISKLEQEIMSLKEKAYENVSEKLQVFEDDFFNDLKQRNERIDQEFSRLQETLTVKLEDISTGEADKRIQIEKEYSETLRSGLSDVQNRTFALYEKFEDQVSGFQNRINERMNITENSLKGLEDDLKQDIIETRNNANSYFQKEFAEQSVAMNELIKKTEREIETEITRLGGVLAGGKKDFSAGIENIQSDITVWQTKVLQEMKEARDNVQGDVDLFRTDVQVTISAIKEDFHRQRDDFLIANQEERNAMKKDLTELSEQIIDLENALRKRSESALESFEQDFNSFNTEFQKKNREFQTDIDQRIKDFRIGARDIQEKTDVLQKKLFGKIEENYKTLSVTLSEIDKKQKNFINQTKLFDRADTLKHALNENIEDLKAELVRVEAQRNEVKETEKKFLRIVKMGEEATGKLSAFIQEKRRIEEMEGDFKKLINISQAVDVKLEQLTNSHDILQDIQARIRNLEELAKDVELKYQRLEKKDNILETTVGAVDKNFQQITDLEEGLDKMQQTMADVSSRLREAAQQIEVLAGNKAEADNALKRVNELAGILADVEDRMDQMQKAREWLAKTETRLEEINKQAQEQVKLLGTIMKDSGGKKGERGAPDMNARELVTRLAHQGFSVKEIAQVTKLSRGEVELILELLPKK